jgi:acetyltransferase-like isoleucine patch superfamily enzyme
MIRQQGIKLSNSLDSFPSEAVLDVEENTSIGRAKFGFRHLSIGAYSYVRSGCELMNVGRIGRFCSISNGVVLGQDRAGHPLDWVTTHPFARESREYNARIPPACIGHDIWIGRDAVIFEGVKVGTGAVIAMRAVVTKDVPPYAVVAGIPARVIKYRHPPAIIQAMIVSRWWQYASADLCALPIDTPEKFLLAMNDGLPEKVYDCVRLSRAGHKAIRPLEWEDDEQYMRPVDSRRGWEFITPPPDPVLECDSHAGAVQNRFTPAHRGTQQSGTSST